MSEVQRDYIAVWGKIQLVTKISEYRVNIYVLSFKVGMWPVGELGWEISWSLWDFTWAMKDE